MYNIARRISVALGESAPDFIIAGASVFNVFTGDFTVSDVLVADGHISAVLPAAGKDIATYPQETEIIDGCGQWLLPGFIDCHAHIESSMVTPDEYANVVAACGVTTVITDPHEICCVHGANGLRYMLETTENAASRIFILIPSSLGSSMGVAHLEGTEAVLEAADMTPFLGHPRVLGLGEVMCYPAVLARDKSIMEKLELIHSHNNALSGPQRGLFIDGHAPSLCGRKLQAYLAAGIKADHETATPEEARERIAAGMTVMMRESSSAKNMLDLVPAITPDTADRYVLCTDARNAGEIIRQGSINYLVRKLFTDGRLPLATILRMASWNAARAFSLRETGAIVPGFRADFALYPNLSSFKPAKVWTAGELVAENGEALRKSEMATPYFLTNSVRINTDSAEENLKLRDRNCRVKVIGLTPLQTVTRKLLMHLPTEDGYLMADPKQDVAKLAVFERHKRTGRVGAGFVHGLGLRRGAFASTVVHDAHNLMVAGMNDKDMLSAMHALREAGGGFAVAVGRKISVLPLPVAGLFTTSSMKEVSEAYTDILAAVQGLGARHNPFSFLCSLSLVVIPSLKLSDGGLVDVDTFTKTSLYENDDAPESEPSSLAAIRGMLFGPEHVDSDAVSGDGTRSQPAYIARFAPSPEHRDQCHPPAPQDVEPESDPTGFEPAAAPDASSGTPVAWRTGGFGRKGNIRPARGRNALHFRSHTERHPPGTGSLGNAVLPERGRSRTMHGGPERNGIRPDTRRIPSRHTRRGPE